MLSPTNILMAFSYILAIAIVAGPGLRLDDAAGVAQDRSQRARDPTTDVVTWTAEEFKRVYAS
jgi:hypothetical protein